MEYVGFVFGIFGLLAYIELSSLKKRVNTLEEELAGPVRQIRRRERAAILQADVPRAAHLAGEERLERADAHAGLRLGAVELIFGGRDDRLADEAGLGEQVVRGEVLPEARRPAVLLADGLFGVVF